MMKHLPEVDAGDIPGPFVIVKSVEVQPGDIGKGNAEPQKLKIPPASRFLGSRTDLICLKPNGEVHTVQRATPGYRCPCGTPLAEVAVPSGTWAVTRDRITPIQEAP